MSITNELDLLTLGTLQLNAASIISTELGAATCSSNAATLNALAGIITSESLSTAAGSAQALTITNSAVLAGSVVIAVIIGGTNSAGVPILTKSVASAGSVVFTILNNHASAAFNGTFKVGFLVLQS